jgi:ribosomal protein S18 acetylase RimI-like enzyme
MGTCTIKPAYDELNNVKQLFREYAEFLGVDLGFQRYDEEISALPGKYALPDGRLYVVYFEEKLAGCVALRKIDDTSCEFKRLFVRPEFRGQGLGRKLMEKVINDAKGLGYHTGYLDTLSTLISAIAVYEKLGFEKIPPYYDNPLENVAYYRLEL